MTLGWTDLSVWDESAPTEAELTAMAEGAIERHERKSPRWCCHTDPCGHLAWARGFLADRAPAS